MINKNQEFELTIESFGSAGEGIGHVDGYTLFVNGALPGERVRVAVTKVKKTYGYARLLQVLEASTERARPACPVAKRCGGCELQHISYEAQLRFKVGRVKECLERIGGVDRIGLPEGYEDASGETGAIRMEVLGCPEENPHHYRNKAQFPVGRDKNGIPMAGFYAARSHEIIPCEDCLLQDEEINRIVGIVMESVREADYTWGARIPLIYDEKTHAGWLRHIYVRRAAATGQMFLCLVVHEDEKEKDFNLFEPLLKKIAAIIKEDSISVCINRNPDRTNVVLGKDYIPVAGPLFIEDRIGDLRFRIAPESFYQVNPNMTDKLYSKTLFYASLTGEEVVWDLYCGIGTISLFLARKAKHVIGVEVVPEAIINAKENASINHIENVTFFCGTAEDIVGVPAADSGADEQSMVFRMAGHVLSGPDIIVVDPPRKGCDERLISVIGKASPERLVYVSCDPATLARDIARLRVFGYELKKVCVVDQFWQTRHVETVALLEKNNRD